MADLGALRLDISAQEHPGRSEEGGGRLSGPGSESGAAGRGGDGGNGPLLASTAS